VGTYAITVGLGTLAAANYHFTFVNGTLTVTASSTTTAVTSSANPSVYAQPVTFTATVTPVAPGGGTPTGNVTFLDGSTPLATVALSGGSASYTTDALGRGNHVIKVVYASVADFSGSTSTGLTQTVQTVALEPDPLDPSKTDLFVGGTSGNDIIKITSKHHGRDIQVLVRETNGDHFYFRNTYAVAGLAHVVVFGGPGNDIITLSKRVHLPALLFGGAGDDVLIGGGGPSVLVGGAGDDVLIAREERSILIGGAGHDFLLAQERSNILIAGTTAYDSNVAALLAIGAEWDRTDADFHTRISHLLGPDAGGAAGGLNRGYSLNATTVRSEPGNVLIGGEGEDWFLVGPGNVVRKRHGDVVTDLP
jgi:Ca2+-binding RTX toxin-like protein